MNILKWILGTIKQVQEDLQSRPELNPEDYGWIDDMKEYRHISKNKPTSWSKGYYSLRYNSERKENAWVFDEGSKIKSGPGTIAKFDAPLLEVDFQFMDAHIERMAPFIKPK